MSDEPRTYLPADASTDPLGPRAELAVPQTAVEGKVFDGEFADEAAAGVPGAAAAPVIPPWARFVLRHLGRVAVGAWVLARRWHRKRTQWDRWLLGAEAAGNHEALLQLAKQREDARHHRADNRVKLLGAIVTVAKASLWIAGALLAFPLVLGFFLMVANKSGHDFLAPWLDIAAAVQLGFEVGAVLWGVGVPLALAGGIAGLWWLGGHAGDLAPAWAAVSSDADIDVAIDERAITQALGALRIPQINDFIKGGLPMPYLVPCRVEGRGTYAELRLPLGLPAAEIAKHARREKLAAGLYRKTKEVWPSVGADESHLKLWIADKGALEEGAGPYPLLRDGACDVFKGVPFGRTLRGDEVTAPLMERNTITGGMPGQGKSSAARAIMIGAALDWRAELWILVPDVNFDFERMKRRCSRYVMGAEDEKVETIRDWLADLKDEVQRRGELLVRHEVAAVTSKLASAGIGLHPLFVLLEEAHVAIQHHIYGKEISGLLVDIVKLGRKRGIHVIVSTQAPTKESMPRDVTRNCSNGIAFAVGDHVPNDALLGQGAYRAGHRATDLIPGTDRGIAVVKGFSGERSEMVQVYFLSVDGPDQVTPVIDRAMAEIERRGRGLPGGPPPLLAIERHDLLDDLDEVIGDSDEKVKLADLAWRLKRLAPSWGAYKSLGSTELREWLDREGVRWTNPKNVPTLDPEDLRAARAGRGELAVPVSREAARSPPAQCR
jgi:S-DNA-T family DNA segregation ATPase FtsK/SpoIIIE